MDVLRTQVVTSDPTFRTNQERMLRLVAELRERTDRARQGGGPAYLKRHRDLGKIPVRDRENG